MLAIYCQRIKSKVDELHKLSDHVLDRQLINILLSDLSEHFEKHSSFIPMMRPPPTFAEVHSML
jgi:hypothetical protein